MADKQISPERQRFLVEMGAIIMAGYYGLAIDSNGVVFNAFGSWTPAEKNEPLDGLFAAMRMVGLDPGTFKFQQYTVIAPSPGRGNVEFPAQLVIKNALYEGMHQLDLVVNSPFVAATEIKSYSRKVE